MKSNQSKYQNVDDYISDFPVHIREILQKIRNIIITHAPDASETIAYNMPAYKTFGKPLVYFATYSNHIGFYATPSGHEKFVERLSIYKQGKGSVQFPLSDPFPYELIKDIVVFRVNENKSKFAK
ncbi:MAG: DUF1801 domain-containing protein [Candidatus Kapabacteria bacterium]|nr:DUF1801 domain-containing protein [Candidatus Kapabacteria bacterium]